MKNINKNKFAIVIGGTGGIGQAIIKRLLDDGFSVAFTYNQSDELARRIMFNTASSGNVSCSQLDVGNPKQVENVFSCLVGEKGGLDVLVNAAGIANDGLMMDLDVDSWWEVIQTNLLGTYLCCRTAGKYMLLNKGGSIINFSSIAIEYGGRGQTNYATSKGGIEGLTKSLAKELGKKAIRVNAVAPGVIETAMTEKIIQKRDLRQFISLKRYGTPKEIAGVVSFLSSEDASYITGQIIRADGGWGGW